MVRRDAQAAAGRPAAGRVGSPGRRRIDREGVGQEAQRWAERDAQIYSDILTLFVVNSRPMTPDAARERIEAALQGRTLIEQAKGVLAEQRQLDMATAYEALLEEATSRRVPLSEVAESVISTGYQNHG